MTLTQAGITSVTNNFEHNPHGEWVIATGGTASAGFDINAGTARSGVNNGWLFVTNGWAFEGDWVSTSAPWYAQCQVQIFFNASGTTQVGIEVWDAYNHLLSSHYPFVSGGSYQSVLTPPWNLNGVSTVFVKAIIGSPGPAKFVRIDDMTMQCYWT